MSIYLDTQCDKCRHKYPNKDGWCGCCAAFPEGWQRGWLTKDKAGLKECSNGIKYEPIENKDSGFMNDKDLRELILSLTTDIEFEYQGKNGSICSFNRRNISITYDGQTVNCGNIDEVFDIPIFAGKSLREISADLII